MNQEGKFITNNTIFILTGAGISAESGLGTFRDKDGVWAKFRPEELATPEAFFRHPERVLSFYTARRRQLLSPQVQPNAAHRALADFTKKYPSQVTLVTQNVDDLHQRAGSSEVIAMHGELLRTVCHRCRHEFADRSDFSLAAVCPACGSRGLLRPAVVWFGEMPLHMERIEEALERCDWFVAIGTSGAVYPAAGFVRLARQSGAHCLEINPQETDVSPAFQEHRRGPASQMVPSCLQELLERAP